MDPSIAHREEHRKQHAAWIRAQRYNSRHEPRLEDFGDGTCSRFKYTIFTTFYLLRSFMSILIRLKTLLSLTLAVGATMICYYMEWSFDLPTTFLSAGIVFPISFGIQFEFNRRERILLDIASLKASAYSLYVLSKEWPPASLNSSIIDLERGQNPDLESVLLRGNEGDLCEKMKGHLTDVLQEISNYLTHKDYDNSRIYSIYSNYDEILHLLENIRVTDEWIKSVVSRAYQYVRYMINDFERIRTVSDFRTPSAYRGFSFVMLTAFPILFAPSFAKIGLDHNHLLSGVYSAVVITLILVLLNNIMEDLEDPFDTQGVDDFNISMIAEPVLLMYKPLVYDKNRRKSSRNIFSLVKKSSVHHNHNKVIHSTPSTPPGSKDDIMVDLQDIV